MADIANSLRGWSAIAGSNQPTDSTTIGAGLDDNLRQIQAVVRQFLASQGTNIASAATMDLSTMDGYYASVTGNTTVTGLGTEAAGISYWLEFASTPVIVHNSAAINLPSAANITCVAGDIMRFTSEGSGIWRCTGWLPVTHTGTGGVVHAVSPTLTTPTLNTPTLNTPNIGAANGTSLTVTGTVSAASVSGAVVAAQANMETGTATDLVVSPGRQHFHPGHPKAWGKITPATTVSASYPAAGVSVVKNGTGDYTITHGVTFSSAVYAAQAIALHASTAMWAQISATTTTTVRILFFTPNYGGLTNDVVDPTAFFYALYGDL